MASSASKSLLEIPHLHVDAFRPLAGRMRLFGKADAPDPPDYVGLAQQQATSNLQAARAQTQANRINQSTPYGSINYTKGTGFDEAAYDKAKQAYYAQQQDIYKPGGNAAGSIGWYKANNMYLEEPDKNDFILNPDQWSSSITLNPEQQAIFNQNQDTQKKLSWLQTPLLDQAWDQFTTPMDVSDIPGLIYGIGDGSTGDTWSKYTGLLMDRMNPDLDQQQAALDTKLANMGLTQGSEGWAQQQQQFAKQRSDAGVAAQLAGANLALQGAQLNNATRQQGISERADLRSLPLKELQQIRSMTGISNPTFYTPGQQSTTSGADLSGAGQSQYNAATNAVNAQNQQAANTTGAGIGLLAAAASFY